MGAYGRVVKTKLRFYCQIHVDDGETASTFGYINIVPIRSKTGGLIQFPVDQSETRGFLIIALFPDSNIFEAKRGRHSKPALTAEKAVSIIFIEIESIFMQFKLRSIIR